ncbi:MAG TPA: hypothetical protein VGX48_08635 [Pyrinomonadaceae bacterium]|jgi:hypothetical protein|nr:hypothetical protein [Pyrinomonadaceae bacterium]
MNRRLANALAAAALFALVSMPAPAQQDAATPRTGEKNTKSVETSCPVHPEFKARTAGRCPKCRAEERRQNVGREKDKNNVNRRQQQEEGSAAND